MYRIGIIGCGQLARMLALEGMRMGLEFTFIAMGDEDISPIQPLAQGPVVRWFNEEDAASNEAVTHALSQCSVVTTERENVPPALLDLVTTVAVLRPNAKALTAFSRRDNERQALTQLGLPVAPHTIAANAEQLSACARSVGFPQIWKTICDGYDGRGQWQIREEAQLGSVDIPAAAFPLLIERRINFTRELAITAVRGTTGEIRYYPLSENHHLQGILVSALAPAQIDAQLEHTAQTWAARLLDGLDYVGVLTIEMFETADGLLINEIAPRVHNSAHWTLGGALTSQFENHLRAVAGMPLGDTGVLGRCAIVNIIGKHPPRDSAWLASNMRLHDYAKTERAGRKLGHVLVMDAPGCTFSQQISTLEPMLAQL